MNSPHTDISGVELVLIIIACMLCASLLLALPVEPIAW